MTSLPVVMLVVSLGLCVYAYVGYPAILTVLGRFRRVPTPESSGAWPSISIVVPVHNEAAVIAETLERILAVDYPGERRQILVVSDASSDGTDEIVKGFAARGVELLRIPERGGKTAAENAARGHLTGEIIVNTDAAVRVDAVAVKHLVAAFSDPSVGVASARDVSVSSWNAAANPGEQAYVGYEMRVRDLETRVSGIVGASGCLYAIRRDLHLPFMPEHLSRDFGAALTARERGYRAVSVPAALCYVPRSLSPHREYRRKVRTMARGLRTLWHKRALLDPRRYGAFAWMLWSHKLCRWLVPWALLFATLALLALAWQGGTRGYGWAVVGLAAAGVAALGAGIGWVWPTGRPMPRWIAMPTYAVSGTIAALQAWVTALGGRGTALWEPTRRGLGRASTAPVASVQRCSDDGHQS